MTRILLLFLFPVILFSQDYEPDTTEYIYDPEEATPEYVYEGETATEADYIYPQEDTTPEYIYDQEEVTEEEYIYGQEEAPEEYNAETYYDTEYPEEEIYEYPEPTLPEDLTTPVVPFKTYNTRHLKSKKMPRLFPEEGLLQDLSSSFWFLKFYGHASSTSLQSIELSFTNSSLTVKQIGYDDEVVGDNTYHLNPIKMIKPSEGIFAYSDKTGYVHFIYLRLLVPHLLAFDMVGSFEDAEESALKSLTDLGVFVLR